MHLSCPACGFKAPIETFAGEKDARHFAVLMGRVPPVLAEAVFRYLALFAPAKHAMTFTRGRAMLEPLVQMIETGRITRHKREWTVSLQQIEAALLAMLDKRAQLTLPLKSHGYFLEVLAAAVDKQEARAEHQAIEQQRQGNGGGAAEAVPVGQVTELDAERRQQAENQAAVSLLNAELKTLKRLRLEHSDEQLRQLLTNHGYSPRAIRFALAKVGETKP